MNRKTRSRSGHNVKGFMDFLFAQCYFLFKHITGAKYGYELKKETFCNILFDYGIGPISWLWVNNHNKNDRYKEKKFIRLNPRAFRCSRKIWESGRSSKSEKRKVSKRKRAKRNASNRNNEQDLIVHNILDLLSSEEGEESAEESGNSD